MNRLEIALEAIFHLHGNNAFRLSLGSEIRYKLSVFIQFPFPVAALSGLDDCPDPSLWTFDLTVLDASDGLSELCEDWSHLLHS